MDAAQALAAEAGLDLREQPVEVLAARQGIAGGEEMTSVQADTQSGGRAGEPEDALEVFEPVAEDRPRPGGGLEQDPDSGGIGVRQYPSQGFGDHPQARLLAGSEMRSRVYHQGIEPEPSAALELVGQAGAGPLQDLRDGRGEVDQVGGVRHHPPTGALPPGGAEGLDLCLEQGAPAPLAGVLDEDLQRRAGHLRAAGEGQRQAPGHRDMSAQQLHGRRVCHAGGLGRRPGAAGLGCYAPPVLRRLALLVVRGVYLGVVLGVFVLSAYVAFSMFVRRGVTPVPSLVGLDLSEAAELVADHGLILRHREGEDRYAEEIPPDRVLSQQPGAGGLAKRCGVVEVVLSRGRRLVAVPDLAGQTPAAAQFTLSAAGLEMGRSAEVFSTSAAAGTVVAQAPAAGAEVDRGVAVNLYYSADRLVATYVMPDLVDREYRQVRSFLEGNGLRLGSVKFEPYEGISRSVVLRQFPLPGHPLRRDEVISLVVASTPDGGAGA
jgi:beta-lactam-binding protein with PASTA domain